MSTIRVTRPKWLILLSALGLFLTVFSGCEDSSSDDADVSDADDMSDSTDDTSPFSSRDSELTAPFETDCESSERPVVMVHGFLASGDTWSKHSRRFVNNGYCIDQLYRFDWDTAALVPDVPPAEQLDSFIDEVRSQNDGRKVDLIGHSQGGGLGYTYLSSLQRAKKVEHYVHVASFDNEGPAGPSGFPVPTLNLYSAADTIVSDNDGIEQATNVELTSADHYEVATSVESFTAIYEFLHDGDAPETTETANDDPAWIYGKVVDLGSNSPRANTTVEIYEVDDSTGDRVDEVMEASFDTNGEGYWGPFRAKSETRYELYVDAEDEDGVPVHYYIEPQTASNPAVYLRTLPGSDTLAGAFLGGLPTDATFGTVIVFFASGAIETGSDDVKLNGEEQLATEEVADPESTTIALFMYDDNENSGSDFTLLEDFGDFPFLNGLDVYFDAEPAGASSTINYNDRMLSTPHWNTADEGVSILIFE